MEKRMPALCSGTRAGHSCLKAARRQTRSPCAPDALARVPAVVAGLWPVPTCHVRLSEPAKRKGMYKILRLEHACGTACIRLVHRPPCPSATAAAMLHISHYPS